MILFALWLPLSSNYPSNIYVHMQTAYLLVLYYSQLFCLGSLTLPWVWPPCRFHMGPWSRGCTFTLATTCKKQGNLHLCPQETNKKKRYPGTARLEPSGPCKNGKLLFFKGCWCDVTMIKRGDYVNAISSHFWCFLWDICHIIVVM